MKLRTNFPPELRESGVTLIECIVYVSVFAILLGIGTGSFFLCWDHTRGTISIADQIESALRAGECWRADVRAATGKISIETTADGEVARIPEGRTEVLYRLANGELRREGPVQNNSRLLLAKVKSSEMKTAARENVQAWQWELELAPLAKNAHFPLQFTFEAAQSRP